jgi:putative NIF3 family GTP cyclohydrolase 1 type 2
MIKMLLKEIVSIMENKLSPRSFCLKQDIYGIQYGDCYENKTIKKIILTIDLSLAAIHHAIKKKANLIISYHGLIDKPLMKFKKNLIGAEEGISDTIAEKMFLKIDRTFDVINNNGVSIPLGRICNPMYFPDQKNPLKLDQLIKRIKTNFDMKNIHYVGDLNNEIEKIAIIGGENSKIKYLEKAARFGCNCYITGNIKHYEAVYARNIGLNLIEISYYDSILISLRKLSNFLSLEFPNDEFHCYDSNNPLNIC